MKNKHTFHFSQKVYKLSKAKFSRFDRTRGDKNQIFRTLVHCGDYDINLAEFDCIFKSLRIGCKDFVASGKFSHQKDNFEQMTKCYKINQEVVALKLEIRIKVKNCIGDFFENQ